MKIKDIKVGMRVSGKFCGSEAPEDYVRGTVVGIDEVRSWHYYVKVNVDEKYRDSFGRDLDLDLDRYPFLPQELRRLVPETTKKGARVVGRNGSKEARGTVRCVEKDSETFVLVEIDYKDRGQFRWLPYDGTFPFRVEELKPLRKLGVGVRVSFGEGREKYTGTVTGKYGDFWMVTTDQPYPHSAIPCGVSLQFSEDLRVIK